MRIEIPAVAARRRGPFGLLSAGNAAPAGSSCRLMVTAHASGGGAWTQADPTQTLVDAGSTVAMPEHADINVATTRFFVQNLAP